jgi:hypothetical protein
VGARTDAARAEVVARRQLLLDEVVRLEAAGRSAVDIPAKIKRAPGKTAAVAAGTAFMVLGGPRRLYRGVRRVFLGPKANMPKSMLPKDVDRALRSLGDDGDRVRGVLEREFAAYLEQNRSEREARDLRGTISELGGNLLKPVTARAGKRLAEELFRPEGGSFTAALERIRARRDRGETGEAAAAAGVGPVDSAPPQASRWERRPARRNVLRPR